MPPAPLPLLLRALAWTGMVLGIFGSMYAFGTATSLLESRDQFVAQYREIGERQRALAPASLAAKDDLIKLAEKEGDTVYSRRGAALPLYSMNIILSILLFTGCASALRAVPWGLSAWSLAALASIPYHVLDTAYELVKMRDLAQVIAQAGSGFAAEASGFLTLKTMVTMFGAAVEIVYFGLCVIYLRRPEVRRSFAPQPSSGRKEG